MINSWKNISVSQYNELIEYSDIKNIFEKYVIYLSIIYNKDIEYYHNMDINDIMKLSTDLQFLSNNPGSELVSVIDNIFHLIDINNIKLGEFIDIEYYFKDDIYKNLDKIATILYRKISYDDYGNIIYENYKNINTKKRSEYFKNICIEYMFGMIKYINDFKNTFNENYKNIIEPEVNEEDLDPIEELTPQEIIELEKEELKKQWIWEILLDELTNGDITKYNDILELPLILVFNNLSYRKMFKS